MTQNCQVSGKGVSEDREKELKLFTRAAEQGDADGQYGLGAMYDVGDGVPQDYKKAYMWYSLSAEQGDEIASESLDLLAEEMTPEQISQAQEMARKWWEEHQQESEQ